MSRGDYYFRKLIRLTLLPFTPLVKLLNWLSVEVDEYGNPIGLKEKENENNK